jgi:hypothetical protein
MAKSEERLLSEGGEMEYLPLLQYRTVKQMQTTGQTISPGLDILSLFPRKMKPRKRCFL